jgi:hypothetical protein
MKLFQESLNTAVFTTKFVIKNKKLITTVYHDSEDGAWEFFSDDLYENYEDVAMVVSLEEIINLDNTVLEISDLSLGFKAVRNKKGDKWLVTEQQK